MRKTPDSYVKAILAANPNMLVPHYLMASYLYYVEDNPIISDNLYDDICKRLYAEWEVVKHWHKELVDKEALTAGTGFHIKYPDRVAYGATTLRETLNGTRKARRP